jgi:hypothetical protein
VNAALPRMGRYQFKWCQTHEWLPPVYDLTVKFESLREMFLSLERYLAKTIAKCSGRKTPVCPGTARSYSPIKTAAITAALFPSAPSISRQTCPRFPKSSRGVRGYKRGHLHKTLRLRLSVTSDQFGAALAFDLLPLASSRADEGWRTSPLRRQAVR